MDLYIFGLYMTNGYHTASLKCIRVYSSEVDQQMKHDKSMRASHRLVYKRHWGHMAKVDMDLSVDWQLYHEQLVLKWMQSITEDNTQN